jgi:hypothetical protein
LARFHLSGLSVNQDLTRIAGGQPSGERFGVRFSM